MGREVKRAATIPWAVCLLLMLSSGAAGQNEHGTHGTKSQLGKVEFRVSCTAEAQESFTRGLALLHSFTYEESAEAFRKA